ncbi:MerR family transcriptional regulator [Streptomyces sp. M-16]|uniref:MerR family transcriptional regulator n=1 Tax=Streptomyces sp. M-16 TaxID=3233040 RepID=UPI003F967060
MITIGQLAGCIGVSIKTVRVYHDKGLLPEPDRDASGYRRYGANDAVELIKIRTLAEAGVPLARIRDLRAASDEEFRQALGEIDDELGARIRSLRETQGRLHRLAAGRLVPLPGEVVAHLEDLARWGFTPRWVDLQRDLWILVFATHPDRAITLFHDQAQILADPALRQLFLGYDHAHDLDADDPRLDDLARRIAEANRERYGSDERPGLDTDSEIPALIQGTVNASSPAWERLDSLIRAQLNARHEHPGAICEARLFSDRHNSLGCGVEWGGVGEGAIFPGRPAWHGEGSVHRPSTAPQTRSTQAGTPAVADDRRRRHLSLARGHASQAAGRYLTPQMSRVSGRRTTSAAGTAMRSVGTHSRSAENATRISTRASCAPKHPVSPWPEGQVPAPPDSLRRSSTWGTA